MTAKKGKLGECCTGHVVRDNLSELYGHLFSNYKEKIRLQFKYTCFIK